MAVSPSDIARTIAAVVKNLNNRRVRCAGDAVNCLCRNDAYSALDSQLILLMPRFPASRRVRPPVALPSGLRPHSWGITVRLPAGLGPPLFTVSSQRRLSDSW